MPLSSFVRWASQHARLRIWWTESKRPLLTCTHLKNAFEWQSIARTQANWPNLIATCRKDVLTMCISSSMATWNRYKPVSPAGTHTRELFCWCGISHSWLTQIDWQKAIFVLKFVFKLSARVLEVVEQPFNLYKMSKALTDIILHQYIESAGFWIKTMPILAVNIRNSGERVSVRSRTTLNGYRASGASNIDHFTISTSNETKASS